MITYHGRVLPVFSIPPDWSQSVVLTEDWEGIRKEALSTAEERLGTLPRPLYKLGFKTLTLTPKESGYIRKVLETMGDLPILMPFWQDKSKLTQASVAGSCTVRADFTAGTLFDVLPFSMLWSDFDDFETHKTFAVAPDGVQFADAIASARAVGTFVVPCAAGYLRKNNSPQAVTDTLSIFQADFEEVMLQESSYLAHVISGSQQYEQRPFVLEGIGGPLL